MDFKNTHKAIISTIFISHYNASEWLSLMNFNLNEGEFSATDPLGIVFDHFNAYIE